MSKYKNIPVDPETYDVVKTLAKKNKRGLGAQVSVMADAETKREEEAQQAVSQQKQPEPVH